MLTKFLTTKCIDSTATAGLSISSYMLMIDCCFNILVWVWSMTYLSTSLLAICKSNTALCFCVRSLGFFVFSMWLCSAEPVCMFLWAPNSRIYMAICSCSWILGIFQSFLRGNSVWRRWVRTQIVVLAVLNASESLRCQYSSFFNQAQ